MVRDQHDDKRRAKVSRMLLRDLKDVTFDKWLEVIFDTTIYWPMVELPEYRRKLAVVKESDPALAKAVEPLLEHLSDWDCKGSLESTQTTLCMAWYEELYGFGYPAETLKPQFVANPTEQLKALVAAAGKLKSTFGNWQVPWGEVNRLQRHADVSDFFVIPFSDNQPSLPSAGLHGPPGVAFTMYFTPSVYLPPLKLMKKHYAVVGTSYMAAVEFGPKVTSRTLVQYGASGDPKSPHFFDQAKLLSERKLRPTLYSWDEIRSVAKRTYHPGEESESVAAKP
jgi:acyl-homoserine lactone acylase PvdQ